MSNDPEQVTLDQLRAALKVLGISPDVRHVRTIHIDPRQITITRYQVDDNGHHFRVLTGTGGGVATEISTVRLVGA